MQKDRSSKFRIMACVSFELSFLEVKFFRNVFILVNNVIVKCEWCAAKKAKVNQPFTRELKTLSKVKLSDIKCKILTQKNLLQTFGKHGAKYKMHKKWRRYKFAEGIR